MERINHFIEVRLMNLDSIILSSGIFTVMLVATFFGINPENVLLYLLVGGVISVYKLMKSRQNSRRSVMATILMGFFLSVIVAPSIELKMSLSPLTVGAILGGLVLLGEAGIELTFKRILGIEIELSNPPERKVKKIQHKKLVENEE